ncbi:MAG: polysaccharide deacetylase [Gemmatimonadetes bacterium]|nr:polysaccharide deacetylase [Gemmatimonadota bacterium]
MTLRSTRIVAILALAAGCGSLPSPLSRSAPIERWAFTAPWDPRSAASVAAHAGRLDAIVVGWIPLDTITGAPFVLYPDTGARVAPSARRRMSIVTSYLGSAFHPAVIRQLALDSAALRRSSAAVAATARRDGTRGLVLDFEGMTGADSDATRLVVAAMARAAHAAGVGPVVVAVPASDTVGYPARLFDSSADLLLVMLYDQHWSTSPPGAIAAPEWVRRTLGMRVAERGASRLVAALPLYGYLWRPNTVASTIGYDDARRLAAEAGTALARDPATLTLHATRPGADGWELWVSDAELVAALEREVSDLGVRRVAYWRLGLEDPAVWAGADRKR